MTPKDSTRQGRYCGALMLLVLLAFSSMGCHKIREHDMESLRKLSEASWMPADAKERAQRVLKIYEGGGRETTPTVIVAVLKERSATGQYYLSIWLFDRTKDVLGIGVKEEWSDPNGTRVVLKEQYPVYTHRSMNSPYHLMNVPVRVRKVGQRKDEKLWADYVAMDYEKLLKDTVPAGSFAEILQLWQDTLPAIRVSLPSPEKLSVSVYVYDKAEHESNAVNVLLRRQEDAPIAVEK